MTPLDPAQRQTVADHVGEQLLAEDLPALDSAFDSYLRTVQVLRDRSWQQEPPRAAATASRT